MDAVKLGRIMTVNPGDPWILLSATRVRNYGETRANNYCKTLGFVNNYGEDSGES